jgi:hypothetical protein
MKPERRAPPPHQSHRAPPRMTSPSARTRSFPYCWGHRAEGRPTPPPRRASPNARCATRAPMHAAHHRFTGDAPDLSCDDLLQPIPGHHCRRSTPDGSGSATASRTPRRRLPPTRSRADVGGTPSAPPRHREGQRTGSDAAPERTPQRCGEGGGAPATAIPAGCAGCADDLLRRRGGGELAGGGALGFGEGTA